MAGNTLMAVEQSYLALIINMDVHFSYKMYVDSLKYAGKLNNSYVENLDVLIFKMK